MKTISRRCKLCEFAGIGPGDRCPHTLTGTVEARADGFYAVMRAGIADADPLILGPMETDTKAWAAVEESRKTIEELVSRMSDASTPDEAAGIGLEMLAEVKSAADAASLAAKLGDAVRAELADPGAEPREGVLLPVLLGRLPCGHYTLGLTDSAGLVQPSGHYETHGEAVAALIEAARSLGHDEAAVNRVRDLGLMSPRDFEALMTGKGLAQA